jgi:hypothetical protein
MNFRRVTKPGEHPSYVCQENGLEFVVYYGTPPGKTPGVWIQVRASGEKFGYLYGTLALSLEQFDAGQLEAVVRQFELVQWS